MSKLTQAYERIREQVDQYKLEYLSPSRITMYLRCPRQYMFRYVMGHKAPPAGIMLLGSASHKTFQFFYEHKLKTQKDYKLSTVTDYFVEDIQERFRQDWQHDDRTVSLENTGVKTVTLFHETRGPVIIPQQIEKSISKTLTYMGDKIKIVGKIDLITASDIVDHKITKRKKSQADIFNDIQLGVYNWAENTPEKAIGWDLYLKHKKVGGTKVEFEDPRIFCRDQDLARIKDVCWNVQRSIRAGIFCPTNFNNWWCSPTWCGFHRICHELYDEK